ncbi:MAG: AlwI family type II restriction endonuclease [Balneolaceae bacterium]
MPNVWNIGNTTVRNPKRIDYALNVFLNTGYSGDIDSKEKQGKLIDTFIEHQVLEYGDIKEEDKQLNGRKWRSCFYQLGFISGKTYTVNSEKKSVIDFFNEIGLSTITKPYEITPAGNKLLNAKTVPEIEEIYSRQLICYELPNALEGSFPEGKLKPFVLFLEVLKKLQDLNHEGITKLEVELFLQKFRNHDDNLSTDIVQEIVRFRNEISDLNSKQQKKIIQKYLEDFYFDIDMRLKSRSVRDYSDTTFRYFSLSGLFTRIGNTLVIRPNKYDFVEKLLESEPNFVFENNPQKYFDYFYNNNYPIPTDEKVFAIQEINKLKEGIRDRSNRLLKTANRITVDSLFSEIQAVRLLLIEYNNWEREQDFASFQQDENAVKDILKYLKVLNGEKVDDSPEIDDRPAFLEWAVWRSFLAIDEIISPIHTTRRFPIDQDFLPRNTAPGGGSDLIFEFNSHVLVVEVTLTTSHRQMAVESEPVRRHTVQYKEQFPEKDVYCLFVAPSVDNNVAETFRIGVWYKEDEEEFVNIVPMSLTDFISTIEIFLEKKFSNNEFKNLLDRCLVFRNVRAPQWQESISNEVSTWKRNIVSN